MTSAPPDSATPESKARSRIGRNVLIAAVVIVAALAAGIWYFFFRDDAPPEFSIDDAASGLDTDDDTASLDSDTGSDSTAEGVDGTWVMNPDVAPAESPLAAGFRVQEELSSIGANTVVGRTEDVSGEVVIDGTTVRTVSITVGIDSLATDDSRRDRRMHEALETDQIPAATFELTEPIDLGEIPPPGTAMSATAIGDMTIHGVTRAVEVTLDAQVVNRTLVVVGSTPVAFADYEVERPTAPIVLSLDDNGTIEFQLYLTRT